LTFADSVTGRIATLSLAAIRLAAVSTGIEPSIVARWLYRFGTVPRTSAIERDFGPEDDPMLVLGLTSGGRARRVLERTHQATTYPGWFSFDRRAEPGGLEAVCKLYVSPRPEALADAFPVIATQFAQGQVRSFKVGRGIEGLLRPDKIVAYFETRDHLEALAHALARALEGCPMQGVPFTAEAGGDGLLSWGVDPPAGTATSWRSWVTMKLAHSLVAARASRTTDRAASALADIRKAGVDPDRWMLTSASFT
jgi:hypothetical protein